MNDIQWRELPREYDYAVRAILNMVRSELDREFWNANQKEMTSPFDNTGAPEFKTDVFTLRSYDWCDGNEKPNFETDKLQIFWYKHSNRGIVAYVPEGAHAEDILFEAMNDAIKSINRYFKETKKS
jgi:hypothetical protein